MWSGTVSCDSNAPGHSCVQLEHTSSHLCSVNIHSSHSTGDFSHINSFTNPAAPSHLIPCFSFDNRANHGFKSVLICKHQHVYHHTNHTQLKVVYPKGQCSHIYCQRQHSCIAQQIIQFSHKLQIVILYNYRQPS